MASFLVGWFATVAVRALNRSIADNTLGFFVAQGDKQVLKVDHCVHVAVVLFDSFFDLVFDECVEILDLFAYQAMLFGLPFGIFNKPNLPEPLLFCNTVCGLHMLPTALHKVTLVRAI
eukprot:2642683-Ditylum_brightwellii.AAC.1